MRDKLVQTFLQEAREHLDELECELLDLEKRPHDTELIGRIFRSMHTIKGSSSMFGFEEISSLTHELESVYDLLRSNRLVLTKEIIELSLKACDHLSSSIIRIGSGEEASPGGSYDIIRAIKSISPHQGGAANPQAAPPGLTSRSASCASSEGGGVKIYHVRFYPPHNIFTRGMDPMDVISDLREMGECKIAICADKIPTLDEMNPECCYASWDILVTTTQGLNALWDAFVFLAGDADITIDRVFDSDDDEPFDADKLGDILVRRGYVDKAHIDAIVRNKKKLGDCLLEAGLIKKNQIDFALLEQEELRKAIRSREGRNAASSVRVPTDKLDALVNLVGEMVTLQASFRQASSKWEDISIIYDEGHALSVPVSEISQITSISGKMDILVEDLRDTSMGLRMVPIGGCFSKLHRLVRDLSNGLGKAVRLQTSGGETELDKTVMEQLNDPMLHIIRNSIDHGIEPPDARESAGKPREATISLSAEHVGANVLIHISDDGAGIDRAAVIGKAAELGLVSPGAELSDSEVSELIMMPGFSTSRNVSSVSGRGVGMDILRKNIESLRGAISIRSDPGQGTSITLSLPLTMAIIDCLLVSLGGHRFLFPLSCIEECVELERREFHGADRKKMVSVRGSAVPYIDLRELFGIAGERPELMQIIITSSKGEQVGFVVDGVIGEHQTVVKPLGPLYRGVEYISGATVLGDGTVALIADADRIIRYSSEKSLLKGSPQTFQRI